MSFSAQVKHEIAMIKPDHTCCLRAELAALARAIGSLLLAPRPGALLMTTENPAIARRIFKISKQLGWRATVAVRQYTRPRRYHLFALQLPLLQDENSLLQELGLAGRNGRLRDHLAPRLLERKCCRRAFLRGCFLGSGFINQPGHAYHLEFFLKSSEAASDLNSVLSQFGLTANCRERNGGFGVYLKEAEQVGEMLRIIGATRGMLDFENSRIMKDMRNRVNRLVNCETSNLDKTVEAGLEQVAVIKEIVATIGLSALKPPIRALAELRQQYPEASLTDLGVLLDPPVGKSGVNHRFRELRRIASRLDCSKSD